MHYPSRAVTGIGQSEQLEQSSSRVRGVAAGRWDTMGAPLAWTLGVGAALSVPHLLHTWNVYWRRAIDYTFQAYIYWCQLEARRSTSPPSPQPWTSNASSLPAPL